MQVKDYYSLLELEPSATQQEIKKAYRRLALQYHPDKNDNEPYAAAQFSEIKEAYEILTNPAKRDYYLQQRWYNQSMGKRKKQETVTPFNILKQTLELEKYVSSLDIFRMDKHGLYEYINYIIKDETIAKLNTFNDISVNKEIINNVLRSSFVLPFALAEKVTVQLKKISSNQLTSENIEKFLIQHKKNHLREKNRIWLILLIAIALILLIYFIS